MKTLRVLLISLTLKLALALPAGAQAPLPLETWKRIVNFRPPTDVQREVLQRGSEWRVQRIENALSYVNFDYYTVKVTTLPFRNGNSGARMTPEEVFKLFKEYLLDTHRDSNRRVSFDLAPGSTSIDTLGSIVRLRFTPFSVTGCRTLDYCQHLNWLRSDAVCNAVDSLITQTAPDYTAYTVVSMASPRELRLSTIRNPSPTDYSWAFNRAVGDHPVAGNRAFGCTPNGSQVTLYTIGADRFSGLQATLDPNSPDQAAAAGYCVAEIFWAQFFREFEEIIKARGGQVGHGARIRYSPT